MRRPHDEQLAALVNAAASGNSRMAVLVGGSSTGKTRACWEAIQPLARQGWRLWHPYDPSHAEAALDGIERVEPHTVVWLNEAQRYLGAGQERGGRIASALRSLLSSPARGPVLVLATLWPTFDDEYAALPRAGEEDPHASVRDLLEGRRIYLPDVFDEDALNEARDLAAAGDRHLAHALRHVREGRLTQQLAGASELVRRYLTAAPEGRALLHAAMDARRLGAGLALPIRFLEQAAEDYLGDDEFDVLADDWLEQTLGTLGRSVHGNVAPLRRIRPRTTRTAAADTTTLRLADYLEEHGRQERSRLCPPESFWHAAHLHLIDPDDLVKLAREAYSRLRLRWAERLWRKAAEAGDTAALTRAAQMRDDLGDAAEAERLWREAAAAGNGKALAHLARGREEAGDVIEAERLYQLAADAGHGKARAWLIKRQEEAGDATARARLNALAAGSGDNVDLADVEAQLYLALQQVDTRALAHYITSRDAANGDSEARAWLVEEAVKAGDLAEVERLLQALADEGDTVTVSRLQWRWGMTGDRAEAERRMRLAADAGNSEARIEWAEWNRGELESMWPYGLEPDGTPSEQW
ncbi:tetratricopeptide repeat protein [Streptomyces sp. NPDC058412]|uniref:tetratricopeptide repeat protein n=1 Tax=Streptomyces sp. NPDC058412 TaxID=3346486 RepID=UPI00365F4AAF